MPYPTNENLDQTALFTACEEPVKIANWTV